MPDDGKGDKLTAFLLFQPLRELGIQPERIKNIEMTLAGFAKEALLRFKGARSELPGHLRVFCQKKMLDDANSANNSRPDSTKHTMERTPILYYSDTTMSGGWGYFIIGRSGHSAGSSERSYPIVDLYLYKEGE